MTTISKVSRTATKKVEQAVTASQELVAKTSEAIVIETPNGFSVTLRKPGILSQFRLAKMLGEAAKNSVYVGMILPLTYISHINGLSVVMNSEREIEALITRLDDDGVNAVIESVTENFGVAPETADEAKEELKN